MISRILLFQNVTTCLSLLANASLKLKVETLYWYADYGQGQQ